MVFNQTGNNAQANFGFYNDVAGDQTNYITQMTDTKELEKKQSIKNLPRVQAGQKSYPVNKKCGPCLEGTRVAVLKEVIDWVTSSSESGMYILSGLAGIGKSTVAYSIAAGADDLDLLGASFFFSRDEADRANAKKFFTTLAYQLSLYDEEFSKAIGDALVTRRGSTAITGSPEEQLKVLILEPLRRISALSVQPILVLVDALDECDAQDSHLVLTGLCRMVRDLPSFKVILTTSLVPNNIAPLSTHKIFRLHDTDDKVVNEDIRLYFKHGLSWEQVNAQLTGLSRRWCASDAEIESLVRVAGKLFIIASIAILFILDKVVHDPKGQMIRLLDANWRDRGLTKRLDDFYSVILRNALPEGCDDYILKRYQSVVGSIIVIRTPLSIASLACLIGRREEEIEGALYNLHSVILIDDDRVPRIYHNSLLDYITNPERCEDVNLRINPTDRHTWIVTRCFEIMNESLKCNILGLDGPARFMGNKEGLAHQGISDSQLQEKVPLWLRYACIYWADHLEKANIENGGLMKEFEKFANNHMLHWFEALSLTGELDSAQRSIRVALKLVKSTSSNLFQLLSYSSRFISKFYDIIKQSGLHTYYSALPFAPTSPDCTRLAIKGDLGKIRSWDIQSFEVSSSPKEGQAKNIRDLALSQDCTRLACCFEDNEIQIWEIGLTKRRTPIHYNRDPDDDVSSFGFSPDGKKFAVGLGNGTIMLWDGEDESSIGAFQSPGTLKSVALSNRMLAAAGETNITLWDLETLRLINTFWTACAAMSVPLSFSDDGDLLAYAGASNFAKVIDVTKDTDIEVAAFKVPSSIVNVAFLPNNTHLVVQLEKDHFKSFNIASKKVTEGQTFNHLVQLPHFPVWHGVPVWTHEGNRRRHPHLVGLFSQCDYLIPVLWFPRNVRIVASAEGSSMIALACDDGQVILVRSSK